MHVVYEHIFAVVTDDPRELSVTFCMCIHC